MVLRVRQCALGCRLFGEGGVGGCLSLMVVNLDLVLSKYGGSSGGSPGAPPAKSAKGMHCRTAMDSPRGFGLLVRCAMKMSVSSRTPRRTTGRVVMRDPFAFRRRTGRKACL